MSANRRLTVAPEPLSTNLPNEFWEARPVLSHIRRKAWAQIASSDALFGIVLARVAAAVPPKLCLPATVGTEVSLGMYVALAGDVGAGKGSAKGVGKSLLPHLGPDVLDDLPPGSGEGLVELYLTRERVRSESGGTRFTYRQVHDGVFLYLDEGSSLADLGSRKGSTILPTIRSAWTGATLGSSNASSQTNRHLPTLSYSIGLVMGIQPKEARTLMSDANAGTPQRFLWASTLDPSMPDDRPGDPGPIRWVRPEVSRAELEPMALPASVVRYIQAKEVAKKRGEIVLRSLDGQADMLRLKVAALLALLDGRRDLTEEDWELGGVAVATSSAVRDQIVVGAIQSDEQERQLVRDKQAAQRAKITTAAAAEAAGDGAEKTLEAAVAIAVAALKRRGVMTQREVNQALGGRHVARLRTAGLAVGDVLDRAVGDGAAIAVERDGKPAWTAAV